MGPNIDSILTGANHTEDRQTAALIKKRKEREKEKYTSSAPPSSALKKVKKLSSKLKVGTAVLKPQAPVATVLTPAATTKSTSKTQGRTVTPDRSDTAEESESSSSESSSSTDSELTDPDIQLPKPKLPQDSGPSGHLDFDIESFDNLSILTGDLVLDAPDKENMSPNKKETKEPVDVTKTPHYKRLQKKLEETKAKLKELQEASHSQGVQLNAQGEENDCLRVSLEKLKLGSTAETEIKRLTNKIGTVNRTLEEFRRANDLFAQKEKEYKAKMEKLTSQVQDLEKQLKEQSESASPSSVDPGTNKNLEELEAKVDELTKQLKQQTASATKYHSAYTKIKKTYDTKRLEVAELKESLKTAKEGNSVGVRGTQSLSSDERTELETLSLKLETSEKLVADLQRRNKKLEEVLEESHKALQDGGKFMSREVSATVVLKVKEFAKRDAFHTTKFIVGEEQTNKWVKDIFDGIKADPTMGFLDDKDPDRFLPFEEFKRIYTATCVEAINYRRQYVQTTCMDATTVAYKELGRIPTIEEIDTVYDLPEDKESDEYKEKVKILTWYCDVYLEAAAGKEFYGSGKRFYERATASTWLVDDFGSKKRKVKVVPVQSEALGRVMYHNCHEKWLHICPMKAKHGKDWPIPKKTKENKDDPQIKKYHTTLYSNPDAGQVKGGGWSDEGYEKYDECVADIKKIRDQDRKNKHVLYKMCLDLIREKHGITSTAPAPKKKRKKTPQVGPKKKRYVPKVVEEDFDEDDFSVGSEGSAGV